MYEENKPQIKLVLSGEERAFTSKINYRGLIGEASLSQQGSRCYLV